MGIIERIRRWRESIRKDRSRRVSDHILERIELPVFFDRYGPGLVDNLTEQYEMFHTHRHESRPEIWQGFFHWLLIDAKCGAAAYAKSDLTRNLVIEIGRLYREAGSSSRWATSLSKPLRETRRFIPGQEGKLHFEPYSRCTQPRDDVDRALEVAEAACLIGLTAMLAIDRGTEGWPDEEMMWAAGTMACVAIVRSLTPQLAMANKLVSLV